MNFEEIRNYWEGRASNDSTAQSTTQDIFLREIELNTLIEKIRKYSPRRVADVGSGDGRTTIGLARTFNEIQFVGFDYSSAMVNNSNQILSTESIANVVFNQRDVTLGLSDSFDLIYTTRCLINLPSWDLQKKALQNIHSSLANKGLYVMIENFIEGHENFNLIRKKFELPEIQIREHNLFFQRQQLLEYTNELFEVTEEVNISSSYYLVSRVVYSKICSDSNTHPDYFDEHHRYAAGLPFCGEFGPVRLIIFKKK